MICKVLQICEVLKFCQFRPVLREQRFCRLIRTKTYQENVQYDQAHFGFLRLRIHLKFEDNTVGCVWVILSFHL